MIGLILMTHETLGKSYTELAEHFFGKVPDYLGIVGVHPQEDPETVWQRARAEAARVDAGCGVLVLADIYGATPCNVGQRLLADGGRVLLAGINAPMVVKALQYAPQAQDLAVFAQKVRQAGLDGIVYLNSQEGGASC
ncbi:MAG: PTS mannose transporter subunit IIA [Eikenella sp.]|nr:PTS mannose transporter subunit IIA [Eikenella sp.]